MEGMMAGAAIGMGGAMLTGGAGAFATGGMRGVGQATLQFAKSMPKNFVVNAVESVSKFGLALRGVMGVQNTAQTYGNTGTAGVGDFAKGTVAMETGAYDSAVNIASGKGTWQDYVGMAMMVAPVGQGKRDLEAEISRRADEAEVARRAEDLKAEAAKKEGGGEAYEAEPKGGRGPNGFGDTIGENSKRPFDPETAGGPIENLNWKDAKITKEGIENVKQHTDRFEKDSANAAMIERLKKIEEGKIEATDYDKRYYTHELREQQRYRNKGIPDNERRTYEDWNDAHTATLEDYKINEREQPLYHPSTIED